MLHYFANQTQDEGRCGNLSFKRIGGQLHLYSYALCIARFTGQKGDTGRDVCLVHARSSSSMTTNSHISGLLQALRNNAEVVEVYDTTSEWQHYREAKARLSALKSEYIRATAKTRDARRYAIVSLIVRANVGAAALAWPEQPAHLLPKFDMTDEELAAAKAAKREDDKRKAAELAELQEQRSLEAKERIAKWRAGESVNLFGVSYYTTQTALRVKGDMVQTSKGAEIPISHAKRLWPMIEAVRAGTDTFKPGTPVGVYKLSQINPDGSIVVGCHNIPYSEIEYIHSIIFKGEQI